MIPFHRPDFQSVLLCHVPASCRLYTGKRLVSYTQSPPKSRRSSHSPITLHFRDGTTASCDLLIGADGVKSAVRSTMVQELASKAAAEGRMHDAEDLKRAARPLWSGSYAYRATMPADGLRSQIPGHRVLTQPMLYFGKNCELTIYPISRGSIINFAAFRAHYEMENTTLDEPWVKDVSREVLLKEFSHLEPEVQKLFQCVPKCSRWAVHTVAKLPTFVSGRVALLGDSAHAMMPYQGAGAAQAIEDAYLLAEILGHHRTTLSTLSRALRIYDAIRRPFAQMVAAKSREGGLLYTLNYPGLTAEQLHNSTEKLDRIANKIRTNWEWAWESTIDGDVDRAIAMLEAS